MNIVTLTLNPAFDIHCRAERFLQGHENLAQITHRQAGGKGVNISRALTQNGIENTALLVLGQENGGDFLKSLESIAYRQITVPGRIRQNITIHTVSGEETRLSFPGFSAEPALCDQIGQLLREICDRDTVVTMTGRITDGLDIRKVKQMLSALGVRLVIDSRSFCLDDLRQMKPWLIKPNQEEISHYLGEPVESMEQVLHQARKLHAEGIQNVMISMGGDGALLVCDEGAFVATPPQVVVRSTIGAGDSSISGFLAAGETDAAIRLRTAVAYGTAACMTEGTLPPRPEDIQSIFDKIKITRI